MVHPQFTQRRRPFQLPPHLSPTERLVAEEIARRRAQNKAACVLGGVAGNGGPFLACCWVGSIHFNFSVNIKGGQLNTPRVNPFGPFDLNFLVNIKEVPLHPPKVIPFGSIDFNFSVNIKGGPLNTPKVSPFGSFDLNFLVSIKGGSTTPTKSDSFWIFLLELFG